MIGLIIYAVLLNSFELPFCCFLMLPNDSAEGLQSDNIEESIMGRIIAENIGKNEGLRQYPP